MDKRVIPAKNYFIFAAISILSFILVFNLAEWYKDVREKLENTSVMPTVVSELLSEEFNNYIVENASPIIYLASSSDHNVKAFEKDFKALIIKKEISDQIIYLDTSKVTDSDFYSKLVSKYFDASLTKDGYNLDVIPNIIIFKDRKVVSVLYKNEEEINKKDVELYLINNEVIVQ